MNISLPDDLRAYVDEHVADEGYASSSEYIRELIRDDRRKAQLRGRLLEGASSPLDETPHEQFVDDLRRDIRSHRRHNT